MSKSLSQIALPVVGVTALTLALAFTFANREYGRSQIETLEKQVEQANEQGAALKVAAKTEADRAMELEAKIAEVQAAAAERLASGSDLTAPAPATDGTYGIGRPALAEEIAAWDVDVLPDGRGLPEGSGDVTTGEEVFVDRCGSCHGDFAEGVDNWPVLAGGFDTLANEDPVKTVGSYWPHLSTAWDYISRSMPFGEAGTLTADETYAIVAYILYSNGLVDDEFVLSNENFAEFEMYNMTGFVIDDRPELEYTKWRGEPCMENCKETVEVTMRSVFLVNTPAEGGSESVMNHGTLENIPTFSADGPSFIPVAAKPEETESAEAEPAAATEDDGADDSAALIAAGEKVFKKCKACHQVGAGASNKTGPHLNGIVGAPIGAVEGFRYSNVFKELNEQGAVWDDANLDAFLTKPKDFAKKTKMSFRGLNKEEDRAAVIEYLKAASE